MKKILIFVTPLLIALSLSGQMSSLPYYWIKFKDKNNNAYSLSNPSQFLSQQSLNRRTNQGIALDETDLPVSQSYIDSITPYTFALIHRLKWFNLVVVELGDSTSADSLVMAIKSFPFVDSIAQIQYPPFKSLLQQNKFETTTPINQNIVYPNAYGAPYHQLNMVNGDLLHEMGYPGAGINIAMMDNGFLGIDTVHYFDSVRPRILGSWNFVFNEPSVIIDPLGTHGTSTFSAIAANIPNSFVGTAPDANFYLYQSEDNNAEWVMEEYHWAAAAEMADSVGAQIFSTSLGYTLFDYNIGNTTYSELNGNTTVITQAGNIAFSKGILVFNSAGNEGASPWYYIVAPADGDSILAVGSVDSTRTISNFSSRGPNSAGRIKPDICAMGQVTYCIVPSGSISTSGGTSFSCPIVAGCAACLWQAFPNKTAADIYNVIVRSSDRFNDPDNNYGYGIPNFYNAYLMLETNYNGNILNISNDVAVYPNPFSSNLNVSLYNDSTGNHTIEVFDLLGKNLFSEDVYVRNNTFEIVTLSQLNEFPAGEYILQYDKQKAYSHRIVKISAKE